VQYIGVQNDVTARVRAETELRAEQQRSAAYLAEIETLAFRDPLTGLLNRRKLNELLPGTLAEAARQDLGVAFLYLDVDGFKNVNDSKGHAVGDEVLTELAAGLRRRQRPGDLTARLGGDEFLVVLTGLDAAQARAQAVRLAHDYRSALPTEMHGEPLRVSIGISTCPQDGATFDALLHAADQRMYADKSRAAVA
jgi:diguanylate cyclase (GGDEF)-like protein